MSVVGQSRLAGRPAHYFHRLGRQFVSNLIVWSGHELPPPRTNKRGSYTSDNGHDDAL